MPTQNFISTEINAPVDTSKSIDTMVDEFNQSVEDTANADKVAKIVRIAMRVITATNVAKNLGALEGKAAGLTVLAAVAKERRDWTKKFTLSMKETLLSAGHSELFALMSEAINTVNSVFGLEVVKEGLVGPKLYTSSSSVKSSARTWS